MPQSNKKFLTAVVSLVLICAVTILTYAWFAGIKTIGSVNFSPASNAGLPELDMWMYYSKNDGATTPEDEKWEEQVIKYDNNFYEYIEIPGMQREPYIDPESGEQAVDDAGHPIYSYNLKSLHFGKVDNLVTLTNDNKVMLRFKFTPDVLNNKEGIIKKVTFTLRYNTDGYSYNQNEKTVFDSIHLLKEISGSNASEVPLKIPANQDKIDAAIKYNAELPEGGTPVAVPDPIYVLEFREDEPGAMQFLQIRYAIALEGDYEPDASGNFVRTETYKETETNQDGEEVEVEKTREVPLILSNVMPINCGSKGQNKTGTETPICEKCANGTCGKAVIADDLSKILAVSETDSTKYYIGEGFYVYIELAPLLDAFGMQENILDYFVPAFMYFDVKLDVEIE